MLTNKKQKKIFFFFLLFLFFVTIDLARLDIVLRKGDLLKIEIKDYPDEIPIARINFEGKIKIPLVGELKAEGFKVSELEQIITIALLPYIKDPKVIVSIEEMCPGIYLIGEGITKPGLYRYSQGITLLEVIVEAGGSTSAANLKKVRILRKNDGEIKIFVINMQKFFETGDYKIIPILNSGDIVLITSKSSNKWRIVMDFFRDVVTIYSILTITNIIKQ